MPRAHPSRVACRVWKDGEPCRTATGLPKQGVSLTNSHTLRLDIKTEKNGLTNRERPDRATKSPGALAGATEANIESEAAKLPQQTYPDRRGLSTRFFWDRRSNSVQDRGPLA